MTEYLVHTIHRSVVTQHTSTVIEADSREQAEHMALFDECHAEHDIEFEFGKLISDVVTDIVLNTRMPTTPNDGCTVLREEDVK